jgi:hypothetical protein
MLLAALLAAARAGLLYEPHLLQQLPRSVVDEPKTCRAQENAAEPARHDNNSVAHICSMTDSSSVT